MSKDRDFYNMSKEERHRALFEMSDEDIDYSDIPPLDEEFFSNAKRVEHPLFAEKNNVRIKPHILNWFKNQAKEKSYQTLINDVVNYH